MCELQFPVHPGLRTRVELASIWAYRAALEPVWYVTADKHVEPEVAEKMRPYAIKFFELCRKHGVQRTASGGYFAIPRSITARECFDSV